MGLNARRRVAKVGDVCRGNRDRIVGSPLFDKQDPPVGGHGEIGVRQQGRKAQATSSSLCPPAESPGRHHSRFSREPICLALAASLLASARRETLVTRRHGEGPERLAP